MMLSFCGKILYTEKGDVETVNKYQNFLSFSQTYYFSISICNKELSEFSTKTRPYYYYY